MGILEEKRLEGRVGGLGGLGVLGMLGGVCLEKFFVAGHVGEEGVGVGVVVDAATDVGDAIADKEVLRAEYTVVGVDLCEDLLCDFHVGCFIFHDDARCASLFII